MLSSPRLVPPNPRLSPTVCNCCLVFISLRLVARAAPVQKALVFFVKRCRIRAIRCARVEICRIEVSVSLFDAIATLRLQTQEFVKLRRKPAPLALGGL